MGPRRRLHFRSGTFFSSWPVALENGGPDPATDQVDPPNTRPLSLSLSPAHPVNKLSHHRSTAIDYRRKEASGDVGRPHPLLRDRVSQSFWAGSTRTWRRRFGRLGRLAALLLVGVATPSKCRVSTEVRCRFAPSSRFVLLLLVSPRSDAPIGRPPAEPRFHWSVLTSLENALFQQVGCAVDGGVVLPSCTEFCVDGTNFPDHPDYGPPIGWKCRHTCGQPISFDSTRFRGGVLGVGRVGGWGGLRGSTGWVGMFCSLTGGKPPRSGHQSSHPSLSGVGQRQAPAALHCRPVD